MATGTYAPDADLRVVDTSTGLAVNGGLVWTYLAGGSTPVATYTDVGLSVANSNPIVAGSDGRFVAFLTPGVSYKFVYETAATPPAHGSVIATRDNIQAVPQFTGNYDVTGTAGESLTGGQAVYLSDGSGSKAAGQWYRADNSNSYSSTDNLVGMVPSSIASAATGTIRLAGQVPGLTVSIGSKYYIGTNGAITATPPTTNQRLIGEADSSTTLLLPGNPLPPPTVPTAMVSGRLTLTSGTAVTTSDVTAATTVYFTPYMGNQIALFDGTSKWNLRTFAEISIAVPATTSQMYDLFVFDNNGTVTLEALAWTNDTTRATALTLQNGVLVKTGATTRRFVGSFRTTGVSGQTEDSATKRYLSNYYNRVRRPLYKQYADATWNYTTATWRQANANTANQVDIVVGFAEVELFLQLQVLANNSAGGANVGIAFGESSTSSPISTAVGGGLSSEAGVTELVTLTLSRNPAAGRYFYAFLESSTATPTTTWTNSINVGAGTVAMGATGWIEG